MKKLFAIAFAIVCVLGFSGCEKATNSKDLETSNETITGYIKEFHNETVSFDEIEWVTVPSERATELGITDEDAPSGFYIHNEESVTTEYNIADKCAISILDSENNFAPKQIELVDLDDVLEQRDGALIPYTFTIENGNIVSIEEHYIP